MGLIDFIVYCVREYANAYEKDETQVFFTFSKNGTFDYIVDNYTTLYNSGNVVEEINNYIENRN